MFFYWQKSISYLLHRLIERLHSPACFVHEPCFLFSSVWCGGRNVCCMSSSYCEIQAQTVNPTLCYNPLCLNMNAPVISDVVISPQTKFEAAYVRAVMSVGHLFIHIQCNIVSNYVHIDPEIIVQPSGVQAPLGAANIIRYIWYKQVNVHENKYWIPYFHTEFMDCIKLFSLTSTCLPCRDKAAWGYKSNSLTKC